MIFDFLFKDKRKKKDDGTLDFTTKKLGLTHNPQVKTIESKASFNERAKAISLLKQDTGIADLQLWKGLK